MEFEKNTPTTAQDIALAQTPKVTLQPVHNEISDPQSLINSHTHQNEAIFSFESESTNIPAGSSSSLNQKHPHHIPAMLMSCVVIAAFSLVLYGLVLIR